jgi:Protein of unknown function (DUF5663)
MANYDIDEAFLNELGITITDEKDRLAKIAELQDELELRVGNTIAEHLSEAQIDEFEKINDKGDEAVSLAWLEVAYPDYKKTVATTFEALKVELKTKRL